MDHRAIYLLMWMVLGVAFEKKVWILHWFIVAVFCFVFFSLIWLLSRKEVLILDIWIQLALQWKKLQIIFFKLTNADIIILCFSYNVLTVFKHMYLQIN